MYQSLIIAYLIVSICLIGLVLIQQGKGADMGASFGAGSSATIFGSSGSGNFLTKATTWLAIAFFVISLVLGNLTANRIKSTDEWNNLNSPVEQTIPGDDSIPSESIEPSRSVENTDVPTASKKSSDSDIPQ
ncbi:MULTISPECIES: preprotein translocase subunit SecG [unclassified Colwellia]|uniref:preprotein translocase subunit SecG n=1 Tax=unclassified Colwellia TaxID=196834 RepID=UPI0015F3CE6E|nr:MULTISPECIES: preprotein translocase subunit SecG [unclassified Colwellia]MBA6234070.1 preprotein translocase subunit SecG [Colwellia sp. MB02u-7]MBA6238008.1 preprotein translocase subunit SecG [Colwellia sp. MB02u-11]MBA6257679.1 preprotein translocase subunit SecG [Colwellia sp. MB3u-28]MBA6259436.1 preprotein translocase subunit SecG [Colwellia sp. MB3u-41]MBA6300744.1 preprotein translocase subunit SecG [Colwellia sp. MB3u-22]